jgi:hypothetical protein
MTTKTRTELKAYFETDDIPTQSEFAELIDGTWNLEDDGSGGGGDSTNTEVLSTDKTLTTSDAKYQFLKSSVHNSARSVILPTTPSDGTVFFIKNNGGYNTTACLYVKNSDLHTIDNIYPGASNSYIWNGSYWKGGNWNVDYSDNAGGEYNISFGFGAKGTNKGVGVGYVADGDSSGTAIGYNANGSIYGAAVGHYADAAIYGAALGFETDTNKKRYSTALGYYSETERYGELSINIDGQTDQENNHGLAGMTIDTTDATPKIMLAGGYVNQYFMVRASSVVVFDIQITARDNTSGDCAAYQVTGAIKRDASSNTAIVGSVTKTVIAEDDASWDVAVTADDTKEALQIEVTGDATNTVQWVASIRFTETHF